MVITFAYSDVIMTTSAVIITILRTFRLVYLDSSFNFYNDFNNDFMSDDASFPFLQSAKFAYLISCDCFNCKVIKIKNQYLKK